MVRGMGNVVAGYVRTNIMQEPEIELLEGCSGGAERQYTSPSMLLSHQRPGDSQNHNRNQEYLLVHCHL